MSDQEWSRICNRAAWTHGLAAAALILVPVVAILQAPNPATQLWDALADLSCGDAIQAVIGYAWLTCLIGTFFPPRRILGRGAWMLGAVGLFALAYWACATGEINAEGELTALGEMGTAVSVIWLLLFLLCVAGIIFDGPKSWERRNTGERRTP